ncbi:SMI1/KNR4 family protein [Hyalangium sp.]|uniref:SMI1/KNR4 family protein n=1 Tax=Hyalangium sp. TaxID=2028555 RepID=UPI002D40ABB8|nr:SMI1/KNR4 family protein [Hyalangium sp.]HYI01328.1 SMI1/KNR4 family protein [Hyalangium sp.]
MHEWLEALQKSAKSMSPGVTAEELRRAETEAGVALPGELGDLYSAFNGGTFEGDVVLYPLHGEGEQASVLEKTRKMLVGLPVAGVWRFGLKSTHRHLFTARKSAMVEQGDGGGPLPEWVQALGGEDWIYGSWDEEKKEMRFYRSLANMLNVLVPPVEHEEFGERTFARAIAAVEGALTELAGDEEVKELVYEYEEGRAPKAGQAPAGVGESQLDRPVVIAAERRMKSHKSKAGKPEAGKKEPGKAEAGLETSAVIAAERRIEGHKSKAGKSKAGKKEGGLEAPAVLAAERRIESLKAPEPAAVPARKAVSRTAVRKAPAKKAAAKKAVATKVPAKKAAAKKPVAKKAPAKKVPAKKVPAKKAAAKKGVAKKAVAKKAVGKKAPAKKAAAKKSPARRKR